MANLRWSKWWWQDWQRDPALRMCSPGARGVWMDMLAIMFDAEPHGHLLVNGKPPTDRQLASVFGCSEADAAAYVHELDDAGVLSRTSEKVIFSRRMIRDFEGSVKAREYGKTGGNPKLTGGVKGAITGGLTLPLNTKKQKQKQKQKDITPSPLNATAPQADPTQPDLLVGAQPEKPRASLAELFDGFWAAYPPRRINGKLVRPGKEAARKAFEKALKRATPRDIAAGMRRYAWPAPEYTANASTWLNQSRWMDEAPTAAPPAQAPPAHPPTSRPRTAAGVVLTLDDLAESGL